MNRNYSELRSIPTFRERFHYLELGGVVGESTFGFDRWVNQRFYRSQEWRRIRNHVLVRDDGYDLGSSDLPVIGAPLIHHMNPISIHDFEPEQAIDNLLDPEYLITTSLRTHNAIHYGDESLLPQQYVARSPGDTNLW